jgi:hypothetical protein
MGLFRGRSGQSHLVLRLKMLPVMLSLLLYLLMVWCSAKNRNNYVYLYPFQLHVEPIAAPTQYKVICTIHVVFPYLILSYLRLNIYPKSCLLNVRNFNLPPPPNTEDKLSNPSDTLLISNSSMELRTAREDANYVAT